MAKRDLQLDAINRLASVILFLAVVLLIIAVPIMVSAYNQLVGWQSIAVFAIQIILLFYLVKIARNSGFIQRLLN